MKILFLTILFLLIAPTVHGATFFIDADCATPGDGSTATCINDGNDSFDDTLDFTESNRNAGDIAIHRRNTTATYDDGTDLLFNSDGDLDNPIILEADFTDSWGDFSSSTETATLTFGSTTVELSASGTEIQAGKWIWAIGDDNKEFAYEVESITSATVVLFLPYKGDQAGSGVSMEVMPDAPRWNTAAGNIQWIFDGDNYWLVQGMHILGTDTTGNVNINTSTGIMFKDVIFEGDGTSVEGLTAQDDQPQVWVQKSRLFNHVDGIAANAGSGEFVSLIRDSLFDNNDVAAAEGIDVERWGNHEVHESEFKNQQFQAVILPGNAGSSALTRLRSNIFELAGPFAVGNNSNGVMNFLGSEDTGGVIGVTIFYAPPSDASIEQIMDSETTKVRSGGSNISLKITPNTQLSTAWEHSRLKLFEAPFFATTSSKTYTVFFASDTTTEFTANPTAAEFWCELEYWGHATNNFRRITKSTGTVDFTTDTDFDQSLAVTVAPSQEGVAYLRCYYAKTQESGKTNVFYVDPIVVVS